MADVVGYLESKGIPMKPADAHNVHTNCFFCGEDPTKRGRLYVNIDPEADPPGLYKCFRCEAKGNLVTLKRHFGDPLTNTDIDLVARSEILTAAAHYYTHNIAAFAEVLAYLKGPQRGLTIDTIGDHQLGYAPMAFSQDMVTDTVTVTRPNLLYRHLRDGGWDTASILATGLCVEGRDDRIVDAFAGMITIPYRAAGTIVAIRGRTWPYLPEDFDTWTGPRYQPAKAKYRTLTGDRVRLYNSDACWAAEKEIIIAEGEADCLVLEQHGYHAVGVPGATIWQDTWDDYFANIRRVYVVFDRDPTGETAAGKLVERLGAKARRIHLSEPNVKCDPTDWFRTHSTDDFDALLASVRKGDMLVSVGDAVDEFREVQGQPGIRFAWPLFDEMIAPGLQPGQIMIVLAKTNNGKTLALLNFMHRMRMVPEQRDFKFLFISLEQTRGEWWDRARRIHRFYNLHQTEEDAARWWRDHILLVDRNRVTEAQLFTVIEDFTYEMGAPPDVICMDYLGYFSRSFRGEAYMRTSDAIMSVKALAKQCGIPIVMPHQVNRTATDGQEISADTGRESGVVEETADLLLTMWSPDNLFGRAEEEKTGEVHLRIGKSRHGGRGTLLNLQFAPISLALVPEGDAFCGQARREMSWIRPPHRASWEQAVYRHRCGLEEGTLASGPFGAPAPKAKQQRWV